jgi:hypothetical protein
VNAQGWLNWFEVLYTQLLSMSGNNQLLFRDWSGVGNSLEEFIISNASTTTQVWDITDPLHPTRITGSLSGTTYRFVNDAMRLREYVAFNTPNFLIPVSLGRINNQDLHGTSPADLLIVTHSSLLSQANRLSQFHNTRNGLRVKIVTTDQVYNEFGSGSPDPTSIRDWVKMYYDRYGTDPASKPRYLLLFGDASFDYRDRIKTNTNLVPAYENTSSLDVLTTYTSDDFYGFLDDNEDINSGAAINYLDIGIGRIPAKNPD